MTPDEPRQIDESIENDLDFWVEQKHQPHEIQIEFVEEGMEGL